MTISTNSKFDYLLNTGDQIEILDNHNYLITDIGENKFYYFAEEIGSGEDFGKLHNENGAALQWKSGQKEYYWMDEKIECSSDEEWKQLVALKEFW